MSESRFRLIDDEAMLNEPDLEYVIDSVSPCNSLALIYGQSGHGKSFVALDAALRIASKQSWYGHTIKSDGAVVYMAAEGQAGLKDRIRAWKQHHGRTGAIGVWFLSEPVDFQNAADVAGLERQFDQLITAHGRPIRLLIVDTWAACLAAGDADENSAKDVGRVLFQLRHLAAKYGLTVWIIHHEGHARSKKAASRARGSSSLKAAVETEISVTQKDDILTITNTKQRYNALFEPIRVRRSEVQLGGERTSCVLTTVDGSTDTEGPAQLGPRAQTALGALRHCEEHTPASEGTKDDGVTHSDWKKATGQTSSTFERARDDLLKAGYVEQSPETGRYVTTQAGRAYLHSHTTPTETPTSVGGETLTPPPPSVTPRRGDGGESGRGHLRVVDDIDKVELPIEEDVA